MVETNMKTVMYSWYVQVVIFIMVTINSFLSFLIWVDSVPQDFNASLIRLYVFLGAVALVTAGTIGSWFIRLLTWATKKRRSNP